MRKQLIALALAFALAALVIACGRGTGTTGYVDPAMEGTTTTAASEFSSETALQAAESETVMQAEAAATSFSAGTTTQALATSTAPPANTARPAVAQTAPTAATQATTRTTVTTVTTTTTRSTTTTTTTAAPVAPPAAQQTKPIYTTNDCAEIIAAVRAYAESKTKVKFVWDTSLTYEYAQSGRAGFHDVPNLTRHGKDSVLADLKYHCDLTEELVSGGNGGVPSSEVHYNVCWFVDQQNVWGFGNGDILFVLVYG